MKKTVVLQKQPDMSTLPKIMIIFLLFLLYLFIYAGSVKAAEDATQVDYKTFITQVDQGLVKSVTIKDKQIEFSIGNADGTESIYVTGLVNDPDLTNRLLEAGIPFSKSIPDSLSYLNMMMYIIMPFAFLSIIMIVIFSRAKGRTGGSDSVMTFGKSKARIYVESATGKTFDDVAGQDEAKEALWEVIDFLHNPKKYQEIGAKIPKGILLVGPPGTGKTLLARAVAGESKVPFFSISGSEFVEMFVGVGASRVRDLFDQAQQKAPCVVFIDEIDAVGKSRNSAGMTGNDEREQTLNQLLNEMDGFSAEKGVVILAATNRPDSLDPALLRPGRFDRRVPVELPDLVGREAILKVHASKIKMDENIDFMKIAKSSPGTSGADLANIINEGALHAVKEDRSKVCQSDLEYAVEVVAAGYQRKNAVITEEERLTIAYHEIGHAIVAAKQTNATPIHKISIIPRTSGALGFTMQVEDKEQKLMTKEKALERIITYLGGRSAEEVILHIITSGAVNDIENATKIARAMVTRFGMSDEFDMMALETINNPYLGTSTTLLVSNETSTKIDQEVLKIIKSCHEKAREILQANEAKLHELAKYLVEKETITGQEFMEILQNIAILPHRTQRKEELSRGVQKKEKSRLIGKERSKPYAHRKNNKYGAASGYMYSADSSPDC